MLSPQFLKTTVPGLTDMTTAEGAWFRLAVEYSAFWFWRLHLSPLCLQLPRFPPVQSVKRKTTRIRRPVRLRSIVRPSRQAPGRFNTAGTAVECLYVRLPRPASCHRPSRLVHSCYDLVRTPTMADRKTEPNGHAFESDVLPNGETPAHSPLSEDGFVQTPKVVLTGVEDPRASPSSRVIQHAQPTGQTSSPDGSNDMTDMDDGRIPTKVSSPDTRSPQNSFTGVHATDFADPSPLSPLSQPAQVANDVPSTDSNNRTNVQTTSNSPTVSTSPSPPSAYRQPPVSLQPDAGPSVSPAPKLISTHLIAHPSDSAKKAIKKVFPGPNPVLRLARRFRVKHSVISGITPAEEKRWNAEGAALRRKNGWRLEDEAGDGVPVGELFWKVRRAWSGNSMLTRADVHLPAPDTGTRSLIRSGPPGPHRFDHDHAALRHLAHPRYHATLSRRHHSSGKGGVPCDQLLAVSSSVNRSLSELT